MSGVGWSYLVVTRDESSDVWRSSYDGEFESELEMLHELGVTGWELISFRQSEGQLSYYFKRPRA